MRHDDPNADRRRPTSFGPSPERRDARRSPPRRHIGVPAPATRRGGRGATRQDRSADRAARRVTRCPARVAGNGGARMTPITDDLTHALRTCAAARRAATDAWSRGARDREWLAYVQRERMALARLGDAALTEPNANSPRKSTSVRCKETDIETLLAPSISRGGAPTRRPPPPGMPSMYGGPPSFRLLAEWSDGNFGAGCAECRRSSIRRAASILMRIHSAPYSGVRRASKKPSAISCYG